MEEKEIFDGYTVEEMRAVYFDKDALVEPAYKLYQLNSEGHRYYYRFNEEGEPVFYPSVTTLIRQTMPTSPYLIDWIVANGKELANEKRDLAAAYGTFMHGQFEQLAINRRYNFDAVSLELRAYMERENLPEKFYGDSIVKIRKDVLAFAQFMKDYKVRPLAVEIALCSERGYAGCIDLPCVMTDAKGNEFPAIVDFKSGRKGFSEDCEIQLGLYREMWNETFADKPITRIFNFAPKDWRKGPSYNLKEQTDSPNVQKIPHILAIAGIEDDKREKDFTLIRGELVLDEVEDFSGNILQLSISDLVKRFKEEQEQHPDEGIDFTGENNGVNEFFDEVDKLINSKENAR